MKTSELTGKALDWAVANCEELSIVPDIKGMDLQIDVMCPLTGRFEIRKFFTPSKDWAVGGRILERERISVAFVGKTLPNAMAPHDICSCAHIDGYFSCYADTPLKAAMRCYVASKLGAEVEVPDELIGETV